MRVNDFGILIPQGVEREDGYVRMPHDTQYTIQLQSYSSYPADAEVTVDGRPIGSFRLDARGRVTIETPPDDPGRGRFTFYKADTAEAGAAGVGDVEHADRGIVRVVFKPGRSRRPVYNPNDRDRFKKILDETAKSQYRPTTAPWNGPVPTYGTPPMWTSDLTPAGRCLRSDGGTVTSVTTDTSAVMSFDSGTPAPAPGITGLSGTSDQVWQTAEDIDYVADKEVTITVRLVAVAKAQAVRPLSSPPARSNPVPPPVP